MKIFYDKDIDYAEIFFKNCVNYGQDIESGIIAFKDEKTDEIIGYAFENASEAVFEFKGLPSKAKIAFLLKKTRERAGYTQEDVANKLSNVSERQYQRAEAGENITIDILDEIRQALPDADFSKIFGHGTSL